MVRTVHGTNSPGYELSKVRIVREPEDSASETLCANPTVPPDSGYTTVKAGVFDGFVVLLFLSLSLKAFYLPCTSVFLFLLLLLYLFVVNWVKLTIIRWFCVYSRDTNHRRGPIESCIFTSSVDIVLINWPTALLDCIFNYLLVCCRNNCDRVVSSDHRNACMIIDVFVTVLPLQYSLFSFICHGRYLFCQWENQCTAVQFQVGAVWFWSQKWIFVTCLCVDT